MIAKHPNPAKIVMVEDNAADVFLLRHALDEHRVLYTLDVLRDGEEAIEFVTHRRAAASDAEPCVIVLDLHLPKHDGTAVLRTIRQEPALASVHVVALTTIASPKDEQEVRDLGVRLYRSKPTQVEEWIKLGGEILEICKEQTGAVFA